MINVLLNALTFVRCWQFLFELSSNVKHRFLKQFLLNSISNDNEKYFVQLFILIVLSLSFFMEITALMFIIISNINQFASLDRVSPLKTLT